MLAYHLTVLCAGGTRLVPTGVKVKNPATLLRYNFDAL